MKWTEYYFNFFIEFCILQKLSGIDSEEDEIEDTYIVDELTEFTKPITTASFLRNY